MSEYFYFAFASIILFQVYVQFQPALITIAAIDRAIESASCSMFPRHHTAQTVLPCSAHSLIAWFENSFVMPVEYFLQIILPVSSLIRFRFAFPPLSRWLH